MQKINNIVMNFKEYIKENKKKELVEILKKSEEEIEKGEGIDSDIAFEELRHKYGY